MVPEGARGFAQPGSVIVRKPTRKTTLKMLRAQCRSVECFDAIRGGSGSAVTRTLPIAEVAEGTVRVQSAQASAIGNPRRTTLRRIGESAVSRAEFSSSGYLPCPPSARGRAAPRIAYLSRLSCRISFSRVGLSISPGDPDRAITFELPFNKRRRHESRYRCWRTVPGLERLAECAGTTANLLRGRRSRETSPACFFRPASSASS